jgi:hypothetical protein
MTKRTTTAKKRQLQEHVARVSKEMERLLPTLASLPRMEQGLRQMTDELSS